MKDATLIADLVRAGVEPDLVGRVVNEITASMSGTNVRDSIRTYETLRKRNQRKSGGKQTMSAPIALANVPENVPDNGLSPLSLFPSSLPLEIEQRSKKEVVARQDRGTRLPTDWRLSPELTALARELGHNPSEFETEFRDFWIAVPGSRGRKCDWEATARNRMRETSKKRGRVNGYKPNATMDAFDDIIAGTSGAVESDPPMRDVTPRGGHAG